MTERYPEQEYFTIIDASRFIGRSATALRHLVSKRRIRYFRSHDGRIQFARADLEAFVQAEVVEPKTEAVASVSVSERTDDGRQVGDSASELRRLSREVRKKVRT